MDTHLEARRVFSGLHDDFNLSPEFTQALNQSDSPFIVILVGNGRVGKSTRANQILTKELSATQPFETACGQDPVTEGCQFVKVPFSHLNNLHKLGLQIQENRDLFLVDCEGLNSIAGTTPWLVKAIFALAQIVGFVIVVAQEVNLMSLTNICNLLRMSSITQQQSPSLAPGTAILVREVGIRGSKGRTFEENDRERCRQDAKTKQQILQNAGAITLPNSLIVLAQPGYDTPDLYWESIRDLLREIVKTADKRPPVRAANLVALFNTAKAAFAKADLKTVDFTKAFLDIIKQRMTAVANEVILRIDAQVRAVVVHSQLFQFRGKSPEQFANELKYQFQTEFYNEANSAVPNVVDSHKKEVNELWAQIEKKIVEQVNIAYFERCMINIVTPAINSAIAVADNLIQGASQSITPQSFPQYRWVALQNDVTKAATEVLRKETCGLSSKLFVLQQYKTEEKRMQDAVHAKIAILQGQKTAIYDKWRKEEDMRINQEIKRKETEEKKRIAAQMQREREEAERRRIEEIDEALQASWKQSLKEEADMWDKEWDLNILRAQNQHLRFAQTGQIWF
jgi:hypothetical protein